MDIALISKTMVGVLERYSKKEKCDKVNIQCILHFNEDGTIGFKICKDYKPLYEQVAGEVLGLRKKLLSDGYIDMFNLTQIVPTHIACALILIGQRLNVEAIKLNAMVCHNRQTGKQEGVKIALYKGSEYIEEIALADMFSDENIMKVTAMQQA